MTNLRLDAHRTEESLLLPSRTTAAEESRTVVRERSGSLAVGTLNHLFELTARLARLLGQLPQPTLNVLRLSLFRQNCTNPMHRAALLGLLLATKAGYLPSANGCGRGS